jgi:hypothetical protein
MEQQQQQSDQPAAIASDLKPQCRATFLSKKQLIIFNKTVPGHDIATFFYFLYLNNMNKCGNKHRHLH